MTLLSSLKRIVRGTLLYRRWQQQQALSALERTQPIDRARAAFYAQFVASTDLVFDVGANMANRTRVLRELCAHVVAVEPQPMCVEVLRRKFGRDSKVTIVDEAVGESVGTAELRLGTEHTLASLSSDWMSAVRKSGRFATHRWARTERVRMTTLDRLIEQHGVPAFIKIDVEGYEEQVLGGLSRPVQMLSFEFVPEQLDVAERCMDRLEQLGRAPTYSFVLGEATEFRQPTWLPRETFVREQLRPLAGRFGEFGDIYVRW